MENSLGKKIAALRKENGYTQDELAEKLNVSPQAVSKWENNISCPDIMLLPDISRLLGVTIDELLTDAPKKETAMLPKEQRKSLDDMMLKVIVNSSKGDKVKVNLPIPLVKLGLEMGVKIPQLEGHEALKTLDVEQILRMVEKGVIGKLIEVESAEGDIVDVVVE